jgi:hypothetical protein
VIRCHFCKTTVADVDTAIHADWIPSFYDGDDAKPNPVCPSCVSARLQIGGDGEHELAPHIDYADAAESAQRGNAWPKAAALWNVAAEKCQDAERRAHYEKQARWCRDMPTIHQKLGD